MDGYLNLMCAQHFVIIKHHNSSYIERYFDDFMTVILNALRHMFGH